MWRSGDIPLLSIYRAATTSRKKRDTWCRQPLRSGGKKKNGRIPRRPINRCEYHGIILHRTYEYKQFARSLSGFERNRLQTLSS